MGHHKNKCNKRIIYKNLDTIGLILAAIGLGMLLVVILPRWIWVLIVGVLLIVEAFNIYTKWHK
ncbi:hypothetical protein Q428_03145 [Fervidicella metallireducens AeB]|uniref:Uncharacterized protein n=1 Tax=Fervidicella metallireducens AeB TaxID=1403537 RepID=A0A017RZB9_9CLOT|nr:hypothetical protein [Fervidicella metallireducens]EYE89285.1 hypothetical protein Q428_03145 [Fervidicella metallireducens AeB]